MGDESAFVLGLACCGTGLDERLEFDELVRVVFEQRSDLRFGLGRPQRGGLRRHQEAVSMKLWEIRMLACGGAHLFRLGFLDGLFRRHCRLRRGYLCSSGSRLYLAHRFPCCDLARGRSVLSCASGRFLWVFAVPSRAVDVLQPDDLAVESDFVDEKVGEPAWLGV